MPLPDKKPIQKKTPKKTATRDARRWWTEKKGEVSRSVVALLEQMEDDRRGRLSAYQDFERLYGNRRLVSSGNAWSANPGRRRLPPNRVTLNVVKSCIDTAAAKISKTKPRVVFQTSDGPWSLKRRAKLLNRYMDGLFESTNVHVLAQRCFLDACIYGTGILKVSAADGEPIVERVLAEDVYVDEREARDGDPLEVHLVDRVDRHRLAAAYPEHAAAIMELAPCDEDLVDAFSASRSLPSDRVRVIESWRLPSDRSSNDGRHTLVADGVDLLDEPWADDAYPFAVLRWTTPTKGFFGEGLAEQLKDIQLEINKLLRTIQMAQHLMAVPRVFVDGSSNLTTDMITNAIGGVIKSTGRPPTFATPPAMQPEVYQHVRFLLEQAYSITGISQLSAQSKKPVGLNSAVAIREYQDVETERFALAGQAYESMFKELATLLLKASRELHRAGVDHRVKGRSKRRFLQQIKWSEVSMEDDEFDMRAYGVSGLPTSPAGRKQAIMEYVEAGWVKRERALELLDFPDLEDFISRETAAVEQAEMLVENMLDRGQYIPPEKYMNLALLAETTQLALIEAQVKGYDDDRVDLLRTFIDECLELQKEQAQQPAPAPPGGAAAAPEPPKAGALAALPSVA